MFKIQLEPTDNGIVKIVKDENNNKLDYKVFEINAHTESSKNKSKKIKSFLDDVLNDLGLNDSEQDVNVKAKNKK